MKTKPNYNLNNVSNRNNPWDEANERFAKLEEQVNNLSQLGPPNGGCSEQVWTFQRGWWN